MFNPWSLPGFSLGGLLALSVSALLWKLPLLSMEVLKKSVICITFGQPLISLPHVKDVVQGTPEFEGIVHSIFIKEDSVPRVLSFLDTECDCAELAFGMEANKPLKCPWDVSHLISLLYTDPMCGIFVYDLADSSINMCASVFTNVNTTGIPRSIHFYATPPLVPYQAGKL